MKSSINRTKTSRKKYSIRNRNVEGLRKGRLDILLKKYMNGGSITMDSKG